MPELNDRAFVDACVWLLLGRAPDEHETASFSQIAAAQGRAALVDMIGSSLEFRLKFRQRRARRDEDWQTIGAALDRLGSDGDFVAICYDVVLGRPGDPNGVEYYRARLRDGLTRSLLVDALFASDEATARVRRLNPSADRIPRDVQLCELANPAKWDNPDWLAILTSFGTVPPDQASMHRKAYEYTQTVFGLRRLGRLDDSTRILSVGAGHEFLLYWLANHAAKVVACDLYEGEWQTAFAMEGNPHVLGHPSAYAPFPYREERLVFARMDGSRLGFADGAFDAVYSLSSIEHFGGFDGARRSVADMARVLKPGGILALATEWAVEGPASAEVFSPAQVRQLIDHPGLRLVQPIDDRVWSRYETEIVDLRINRFQTPHMLLRDGETVFTTVFVFLEKL